VHTTSLVAELADLYRVAASVSVDEFPAEVLARMSRWIEFDGAVFGFGQARQHGLRISAACVHRRDPSLLEEYARVSHADPMTAAFLRRPRAPLVVDAQATYAHDGHAGLAAMVARHDLRHLMLFGDRSRDQGPLRWVVLYRGTDRPFDAVAADRLWSVWQHVSCSLDLNCALTLDREEAQRSTRALALVDGFGTVEVADPAFHALLAREWPQNDGTRLPPAVASAMAAGERFAGRAIEVAFRHLGQHVLCRARQRQHVSELTTREQLVAEHYTQGLSHKEVAHLLHVSPNTVRTQLASVYRKLGIRDKATLARRLMPRIPEG
jgi:DNA-binding CsgD family transcriptional regulator